jgi:hypothetical protein
VNWATAIDARLTVSHQLPVAEREGFEPSDEFSLVNSLAVSPIRPLSHLSLSSELEVYSSLPSSTIFFGTITGAGHKGLLR